MNDDVEVVLLQGDRCYVLWRGDREILERGCARFCPLPPIATEMPFEIKIQGGFMSAPKKPANNDRLTSFCEDLVRLVVNGTGGIPGEPGGLTMRQIVREAREMYSEIETPTKPKSRTKVVQREEDEEEWP